MLCEECKPRRTLMLFLSVSVVFFVFSPTVEDIAAGYDAASSEVIFFFLSHYLVSEVLIFSNYSDKNTLWKCSGPIFPLADKNVVRH